MERTNFMWNPCLKTGAVVYIRNLDEVFVGDLFYFRDTETFILKGIPRDLARGQLMALPRTGLRNADVDVIADMDANNELNGVQGGRYSDLSICHLTISEALKAFLIRWSNFFVYADKVELRPAVLDTDSDI